MDKFEPVVVVEDVGHYPLDLEATGEGQRLGHLLHEIPRLRPFVANVPPFRAALRREAELGDPDRFVAVSRDNCGKIRQPLIVVAVTAIVQKVGFGIEVDRQVSYLSAGIASSHSSVVPTPLTAGASTRALGSTDLIVS